MRILIGYDGSDCARAAIDDLRRAGLPPRCEAVVLSVADVWLPAAGFGAAPASEPLIPSIAGIRARAREALDQAAEIAAEGRARLEAEFPDWSVRAETSGDSPVWSIIQAAEKQNADLVVVGSHGRSGLGRALMGSVSIRILDELKCNVRIARAPRERQELRILVGVDGSADADAAVAAVAARAWPAGTKIRVMTAANWRLFTAPIATLVTPEVTVEAWAEAVARRSRDQLAVAGAEIGTRIASGDAKRVLLAEAELWEADCIFVGARGLTRAERWFLGSISAAVASRAGCSVEVIRAPAA